MCEMNQPLNELHWIPDSVASTAVSNDTFPGRVSRDCESFPLLRGRATRRSSCAEHPPITTKLEDNPTEYVVNVSLTFGDRGDAEQAETQLATTVFNGLVSSWSEVEEVRW